MYIKKFIDWNNKKQKENLSKKSSNSQSLSNSAASCKSFSDRSILSGASGSNSDSDTSSADSAILYPEYIPESRYKKLTKTLNHNLNKHYTNSRNKSLNEEQLLKRLLHHQKSSQKQADKVYRETFKPNNNNQNHGQNYYDLKKSSQPNIKQRSELTSTRSERSMPGSNSSSQTNLSMIGLSAGTELINSGLKNIKKLTFTNV